MLPPTLLVFSHLRWGFVYQRPQHLLTRLAQHWPVVFIEEPMHDESRPAHLAVQVQHNGVTVLTPHTPVHAAGFHDDQLPVLEPLLAQWLAQQGIAEALVWLYTPMALPLVKLTRPLVLVYDCMDELSAFHGAPKQLRQRETALMKRADLVFTGGPSLYQAKRSQHPRVLCLPSSVDAAHFSPKRLPLDDAGDTAMQAARALQPPRTQPRLGFFGVIDERLDLRLVDTLSLVRPDWEIVMVGPVVKIDPASLPQRENIRWLGQQPYALLPALMSDWDVCLMPFALNEATRFISPTKTLEYMAGEKPVVSTSIHDVALLYGELVAVARQHADFIEACAAALAETPADRQRRIVRMRAVVSEQSWDLTAEAMHVAIDDRLASVPDEKDDEGEGELMDFADEPAPQQVATGTL